MSEHPLDPNGRKCLRSDCDRLLPREEDYPWKACEACRQTPRSLKQAGQDQTRGITDITNNSAIPEKPTEDPKTLFPSYQDFGRLLQDFENRLRGFLFAQAHYLQVVKQSREKTAVEQGVSLEEVPDVALPMAFYFEGEFSIIADPSGGDMSERIVDAKKGIEGMIGTTLAYVLMLCGTGYRDVAERFCTDQGILAWFSCSHELVVPSIPLAATPSKSITDPASHSAQAIIKRMQGDLNILLSWDRRHRFFPGLRTVVRFQLVG
ncbi:hypothetical protein K474DRAFT_1760781 [Panus rudis PR-1116 ss-1]|nr:hypothetical protein K474DRAFT_1760781 [Panus rudis PR-1116 ss-1]